MLGSKNLSRRRRRVPAVSAILTAGELQQRELQPSLIRDFSYMPEAYILAWENSQTRPIRPDPFSALGYFCDTGCRWTSSSKVRRLRAKACLVRPNMRTHVKRWTPAYSLRRGSMQ